MILALRLVTVCAIGGCSASSSPIVEPPPSSVAADSIPVDASPAVSSPEPSRQQPHEPKSAPVTTEPAIPGASGFWCYELRRQPGDAEFLNACYRTERTCQFKHQQMIDNGGHVTACARSDSAHCFTMAKIAEHTLYWRCFGVDAHCRNRLASFQREYPQVRFTECRFTAFHPSGPQRPAISRAP